MDETTLQLILTRMDENHDDLAEVKKDIAAIRLGIVGQASCDAYRRDFEKKLQSHDTQIRELKTVCDGYIATKTQLIDGVELQEAKSQAIQESGTEIKLLAARVSKIEDRSRLIDLTWDTVRGNSVLKGAFGTWFLAVALIGYGRINEAILQYGLHTVIVAVGVIVVGLIMVWALWNKDATKKVLGVQ